MRFLSYFLFSFLLISCYSLDFPGCIHPSLLSPSYCTSLHFHFSSWSQGSVWPPAQTKPHGSTAEMRFNVNFRALMHRHCEELNPSAYLSSKTKHGSQHLESQPQLPLRCPCLSVRGAGPAVGPGEEGLWQQYWEKQGFPQRNKVFLRHLRGWHQDHMAPYLLERDLRVFPSDDKAQNQLPCQRHVQNIAGMSGQKNAAPNPPSWEMLVQGLNGLTLSLGANIPVPLPQQPLQQQEQEDMHQLERQQESQKMFQRMLR